MTSLSSFSAHNSYDISTDEITGFIRIPLEYVDKLEIGESALCTVGGAGF